jgi:hypothetical protein
MRKLGRIRRLVASTAILLVGSAAGIRFHPTGWGAAPDGSNASHQLAAFRASHSLADAQAERTISSSSALWKRPSGPL